MKRWRLYPIYKPSGIEWLGEIPEHWEFFRLKYCAGLINEKVDGRKSELPYTGLEHIESWTGKRIAVNETATSDGQASRYKKGDVLFGKLRPYLAKALCIREKEGICTGELLVLRPKCVIQDYLLSYILSSDFISVVDSSTYGAKMPRASWEFIGNLPVFVPPLDEQRAIAAFLDRETARIDALVATKEHFIELLAEKRTALISQAVTKGLDPDVPLKDSGVEWLGEIPGHWEVKRLKHIARINLNTLTEGTEPDYVIKYIDIGNVGENGLLAEPEKMIFGNAPSRARRIIKKDNVIISTVRTYLKAIAHFPNPEDNLVCSTGFAVLEPGNLIIPRFLYYLAHCDKFIETIMAYSVGLGYPAINTSVFAGFPVWLPTISEQETIAAYLDTETAKIDSLITKTRKSIEKLKEYRTALVSAAVTGKIDVRKEAP
jgi:type I restriction enzyme S subunit